MFPLAQRLVLQDSLTEIEAALCRAVLEDGAIAKQDGVELAFDSVAALASAIPADCGGVPAQHAGGLSDLSAESGLELSVGEEDSCLEILRTHG